MFGKATFIAGLLVLTLVPVWPVHAAGACLRADLDSFIEVDTAGDLVGFPGWTQVVAYTNDRVPFTPTLLAVNGAIACDLTHGLAGFLGARAVPRTATDAIESALLAVAAIHVDVLPDAVPIRPPVVTWREEGTVVDMTVWTPRNGVVADVRVVMDGDIRVSFVARERGVGAFEASSDGWNLRPGMTDATVAGEVGDLAARTLSGAAPDGKVWRITYFTHHYPSEAEADLHAQMHLTAALAAYANLTAWGFASTDPDGTLDVTLDGCACIYAGHNVNIHMFPRANDLLALLPGLAYRSEEEFAQLVLGHELFHHMQYGLMQWGQGSWMLEGMARFSETANGPDMSYLPTSIVYHQSSLGMNGFLLAPDGSIAAHSYDWSIVWGYLYAHEGGIALLKEVLVQAAGRGTDPNVDGPAIIQAAMDATPGGEHATFADAYAAFARALFTREGWEWGAPDGSQPHDWSTYFVEPARLRTAQVTHTAQPWGIRVHDAEPSGTGGTAIVAYAPNANLVAWSYTRIGSTVTVEDARPLTVFTLAHDAALIVVRPNAFPAQAPVGASGQYAAAIVR